jgi:hypothetical protein
MAKSIYLSIYLAWDAHHLHQQKNKLKWVFFFQIFGSLSLSLSLSHTHTHTHTQKDNNNPIDEKQ